MPLNTSDAIMNTMKDKMETVVEEMEDGELDEKVEAFVTSMIRYMLEKIRKVKIELDNEKHTRNISGNSCPEESLAPPNGQSATQVVCPYPVKEIVKRFRD
jgi:hypothetical protein